VNLVEHYVLNPEWTREPSHKQFKYRSYLCIIIRDSLGILHGYVGLPSYVEYRDEHLLRGVSPHNGLSLEGKGKGDLPLYDGTQELYWIGFHCGGKDDLIPLFASTNYKGKTYKNMLFVEREIKNMVDQIIRNG
jgi:hypothetical protein